MFNLRLTISLLLRFHLGPFPFRPVSIAPVYCMYTVYSVPYQPALTCINENGRNKNLNEELKLPLNSLKYKLKYEGGNGVKLSFLSLFPSAKILCSPLVRYFFSFFLYFFIFTNPYLKVKLRKLYTILLF